MSDEAVERFRPTSGKVLGILALVLSAAVVVIGIVDRDHGFPFPVVAGALVFGVLVWSAMLRPRVWVTSDRLVLRNMLDEVSIPLAAIEQVVVRQVLAVGAGEKRYVSPAVGKSWRKLRAGKDQTADPLQSYPDFVQDRISQLAEDARAQAGVKLLSDEQLALAAGVRRRWAWPEVVALGASIVLFLVAVVV
ncbi:hypothetical protein H5V45_16435 [Nocardioides sp. KIGAM211]|uniref:PH domain-containing protein n=1 Tax=Nocardioides luti TaxID=2761101 RepID=A0A7X0VCE4_9ACTN|nr:hypothetical protein [Nocardioides luti]MBB6628917.1 hypothetical protein [Nocardioides luti]